jgi:hypothetical protein
MFIPKTKSKIYKSRGNKLDRAGSKIIMCALMSKGGGSKDTIKT